MEVVLVSVATGALKPVLEKLATLLGDEYKRFKGVRGEIQFLIDELTAMHAFLLEMSEEEEPGEQDKVWMTAVRELSYDMEDSIDDFMQGVGNKDTKPDGFIEKIKNSLGKLRKIKDRRRIGNEIQDLKTKIIEVAKRNERYKTRHAISNKRNAAVDPRALAIFEHASNLVGMDKPKADLTKLLNKENGWRSKYGQLNMVSILGSGGMGKTTLANQLYHEHKGEFSCCAFLSVSRSPNMMNILRIILSEVTGQPYGDTEAGSIQQVIRNIKEFLEEKRYFIVVDDIWDINTWDAIKCAFPKNDYSNVIITTTRMTDVAHSCRSSFDGRIYNIKPLDMPQSRQLFYTRLNSKEDCLEHLKEVCDQILQKCDGLPLAIIAIAGLLANKESVVEEWEQVKNSIGRALERNASVEGMMKILSLSYFELPPHLKTCLLYLSIFQEDHIIEKNDVITRWIAEGFIHKEGRFTLYELGQRCFNELVNRSLVQPVNINKCGKVKSCRVHDTILDFITSKSIEENFVTFHGVPDLNIGTQQKVRRVSLQVGNQGKSSLSMGLVLSHVRTINVVRYSGEIPSLDKFKYLRVLDFGNCSQLENRHLGNIGRLLQLRRLNLRNTRVNELPKDIGCLVCLQMLDIRGTHVYELPASIVNLRGLMYFLTDTGIIFPDGIAKMQALEILKWVAVFKQSVNFLQEVGQLKNLRKMSLDLRDVCGSTATIRKCRESIASSLQILGTQNLRSLIIVNADCFLLEQWNPASVSLRKLMTSNLLFPQVPRWIFSLINLQKIQLEVERVVQEDLRNLGSLPALLALDLTVTTRSKDGLIVNGGVGFRCLRAFFYHIGLLGGMDLMFTAGSMPKLEKLEIEFNAAESDSMGTGDFDFGIKNLPCLTTITCITRGWLDSAVSAAKAAMEKTARAHTNHPIVLLS